MFCAIWYYLYKTSQRKDDFNVYLTHKKSSAVSQKNLKTWNISKMNGNQEKCLNVNKILVFKFHFSNTGVTNIQSFTPFSCYCYFQKQPFQRVLRKRCSENIQQIYWRTPMSKCDFNTHLEGCSCTFITHKHKLNQ